MIFPQVYPLLGVVFWTIVACLQFVCGYKNTTLQQNLGWKRADREEQVDEQEMAESEAAGSVGGDIPAEALEIEVQDDAEETLTVEKAPPTSDAVEIPPTPFLHVAAPAKSVPTVNTGEQQKHQDDAIWRNCNSETECKRREERGIFPQDTRFNRIECITNTIRDHMANDLLILLAFASVFVLFYFSQMTAAIRRDVKSMVCHHSEFTLVSCSIQNFSEELSTLLFL